MKTWWVAVLAVALVTSALPSISDAKRLGGGRSSGMQRDMPARTAPDAAPAKPAAPAQQAATPGTAAAPAAATPPKRNWMGPLAGLAAGLGLAALMSHLGMGAGFANILMMLLLAGAAFFVIRFLLRRFAGGQANKPAFAGAAGAADASPESAPWQSQQATRTERSPFDGASSTPVGAVPVTPVGAVPVTPVGTVPSLATAAAAQPAAVPEVAKPAVARALVPASFDAESFARAAKLIFIRMQAANDAGDLNDLRDFTTPEMFAAVRLDIQDRGNVAQRTDVVKVDAQVLDVATEGDRQVVSVRFQGQVLEEAGAAPNNFDEIWHLVKPLDDSRSWQIAGIEQRQ